MFIFICLSFFISIFVILVLLIQRAEYIRYDAIRTVLDEITDGFFILDLNYVILEYNKLAQEILNCGNEFKKGENLKKCNLNNTINSVTNKELEGLLYQIDLNIKAANVESYYCNISISQKEKIYEIHLKNWFRRNKLLGTIIFLKEKVEKNGKESNERVFFESEISITIEKFLGNMAHNIRTPLIGLKGCLAYAEDSILELNKTLENEQQGKSLKKVQRNIENLLEQIKNMDKYGLKMDYTIKRFLDGTSEYSLSGKKRDMEFDINSLLQELELFKEKKGDINIIAKGNMGISLKGFKPVLLNIIERLVDNSLNSYKQEATKKVNVKIFVENDTLLMEVEDFGCGIVKMEENRIFKSTFYNKENEGFGTSLFFAYSVLKDNFKGELSYVSEPGKGTSFKIKIPIVS